MHPCVKNRFYSHAISLSFLKIHLGRTQSKNSSLALGAGSLDPFLPFCNNAHFDSRVFR